MADDRLKSLTSFTRPLAGAIDHLVLAPGEHLSNSGFPATVRNFHINRLPQFSSSIDGVICAYCGTRNYGLSCEVDHIIPIAVYCRFKLLQLCETRADRDIANRVNAMDMDRFAGDQDNLILSCKVCNRAKRDKLPDAAVSFNGEALQSTFAAMRATFGKANLDPNAQRRLLEKLRLAEVNMRAISRMSRNTGAKVKHRYILGTHKPRARISERLAGAAAAAGAAGGAGAGVGRAPMPDLAQRRALRRAGGPDGETEEQHIQAVQLVVAGLKRPPGIAGIRARLEPDQTPAGAGAGAGAGAAAAAAAPAAAEMLRVCYYCLGLFRDEDFQLDHIIPRKAGNHSPKDYNDPSNLIPVCSTCNGSKQDAQLTSEWMDARAAERIQSGMSGMESVLTARQYAKAENFRRKLFGFAEQ